MWIVHLGVYAATSVFSSTGPLKDLQTVGWFFGFKLHLVINDKGEILNFVFTTGGVDDREPLKEGVLLKNIKGKFFGDKGILEKLFLRAFLLMVSSCLPKSRII